MKQAVFNLGSLLKKNFFFFYSVLPKSFFKEESQESKRNTNLHNKTKIQ